jgi:hypothetical protein
MSGQRGQESNDRLGENVAVTPSEKRVLGGADPQVISVPAEYVAITSRVPLSARQVWIEHLQNVGVPVWTSLVRDGILCDRLVFEATGVLSELDDAPPWNVFQLARVTDEITPGEYLAEEMARLRVGGFLPPAEEVVRIETLESTPRSFFPPPSGRARSAFSDEELQIEYIDIFDDHITEYEESMSLNSGPAVGQLIEKGMLSWFVALRTRAVHDSLDRLPDWNHIHLMAGPPIADFPLAAFDRALREVNPDGGGYETVFGHLDQIRIRTKVLTAREITALRIPGATVEATPRGSAP